MRLLLIVVMLAATARAEVGDGSAPDGGETADGGPPESGCARAISHDNAQALYAALKDLPGADGCKLEEVRTEKDVMHVEWKKNGVSAPLIEIRPSACAEGTTVSGPEFSMSAPEATAQTCPDAVAKMKALIASERFGGAVKLDRQAGWLGQRGTLALVGGAVALLLLGAALVIRRRRRQ